MFCVKNIFLCVFLLIFVFILLPSCFQIETVEQKDLKDLMQRVEDLPCDTGLYSCFEQKYKIAIKKDGSGEANLWISASDKIATEVIPRFIQKMPSDWNIFEEKKKEGKHTIVFYRRFKDVSELNDKDAIFTFSQDKKNPLKNYYMVEVNYLRESYSPALFSYVPKSEVHIKVPGKIIASNGFKISPNEVKWQKLGEFDKEEPLYVTSSSYKIPKFESLKQFLSKIFDSILYRKAILYLHLHKIGNSYYKTVWIVESDGKNRRQFIKEKVDIFSTTKDGENIIWREKGKKKIFIYNLCKNKLREYTLGDDLYSFEISPNGRKVALIKVRENFSKEEIQEKINSGDMEDGLADIIQEKINSGDMEDGLADILEALPKKTSIYIADINTRHEEEIILPTHLLPKNAASCDEWKEEVLWSPNSDKLIICRVFCPWNKSEQQKSYCYMLDLSQKNITFLGLLGIPKQWSYDKIIFSKSIDEYFIYNPYTMKREKTFSSEPIISPYENSLVYDEYDEKKGMLIVEDLYLKSKKIILSLNTLFFPLEWSYDGKHILFSISPDTVCIINKDGTNFRKIAENSFHGFWIKIPRISFISPCILKIIIFATLYLIILLLISVLALTTISAFRKRV